MNWIELIGQTLIHFVWQGGLLMGLAMALLVVLRQRSAQSRYLACCAVLMLMAIAPIVTGIILAPDSRILTSALDVAALPGSAGSATIPDIAPTVSPVPMPDEATLRWIVIAWLIGVAALTLRVLGGFVTLAGLTGKGRHPVPPELMERFVAMAERMGIHRLPKLYLSERVSVPTVVGAFRGMVLLPVSVATGMPPRLLDTILAHELAHVARFDFLVNAFQAVIEVVLFYHPAVWWVSQRIREERENCCDDLVIATLSDRKTYARALTALAELRGHSLAVRADGGELLVRIRRILGETSMKTILSPFPVAILLGALIIVPALQGYSAYAATDNPTSTGQPRPKKTVKQTKKTSDSKARATGQRPGSATAAKARKDPFFSTTPRSDVAAAKAGQSPFFGTAPRADVAARPGTAQRPNITPAKAANDPFFSTTPRSDVAEAGKGKRDKLPSSTTPFFPEGQSSVPVSANVDSTPAPDTRSSPASIKILRQAGEYLIEELSQDLEAVMDQRKFLRDRLVQTERELVEIRLRRLEVSVADATDTEQDKKRRAQELDQLEAKMIRLVNQRHMLEENLTENGEHLAQKRNQLEKAWRDHKDRLNGG